MRVWCVVLASAAFLTSGAHAKGRFVSPGEQFTGPLLNIRAPNTEGWQIMQSSNTTVAFAREGSTPGESYIASVSQFALPEMPSRDDFVAFFRRALDDEMPAARFQKPLTNIEYKEDRGYRCVLYRAKAIDTKAKRPLLSRTAMVLQMQALYCELPKVEKTGFVISFSHRGATEAADFESQAQAFVDGVQVPNE